jgi:RNA polymerase sigma-70 factor (family 1)
MNPEEEATWRGIQQKNGPVFEDYYKAHYRFFFLASCKYLKDPQLAQEVVNDVFIRLWNESADLAIQHSLKFYIYRAVVNRSLNQLDKDKKEQQRRKELAQTLTEAIEWKEMENNELKLRLYQTIDRLPEQCRLVFHLSRFQGLKQQEIADRLGISIKTVKNHITRALKDLNKVFADYNHLPFWIMALNHFILSTTGTTESFFCH